MKDLVCGLATMLCAGGTSYWLGRSGTDIARDGATGFASGVLMAKMWECRARPAEMNEGPELPTTHQRKTKKRD